MLQFASTWRQYNPTPHAIRHRGSERSGLEGLESSISDLQRDLKKLTRAVDHGSKDADREFYRAPLRIGKTSLVLQPPEHASFSKSLSEAYAHMAGVALWTNSIIGNHPALASEIGAKLHEPLTSIAERLNAAMESGRPVGEVIAEFREVLEIVAEVLENKLREQGN